MESPGERLAARVALDLWRAARDPEPWHVHGLNGEPAVRRRLAWLAGHAVGAPAHILSAVELIDWHRDSAHAIRATVRILAAQITNVSTDWARALVHLVVVQRLAARTGWWPAGSEEAEDAEIARLLYADTDHPPRPLAETLRLAREHHGVGRSRWALQAWLSADRLHRTPLPLVQVASLLRQAGDLRSACWAVRVALLEPRETFDAPGTYAQARALATQLSLTLALNHVWPDPALELQAALTTEIEGGPFPRLAAYPSPVPSAPITGVSSRQVPGASARQAPGVSSRQAPGVSSRQAPGASARQVPGAFARQAPGASARQAPGVSARQAPGASARQIPAASSRQVPAVSSRQVPGVSSPQMPGASARQMPGASSRQVPGASSCAPTSRLSAHPKLADVQTSDTLRGRFDTDPDRTVSEPTTEPIFADLARLRAGDWLVTPPDDRPRLPSLVRQTVRSWGDYPPT